MKVSYNIKYKFIENSIEKSDELKETFNKKMLKVIKILENLNNY